MSDSWQLSSPENLILGEADAQEARMPPSLLPAIGLPSAPTEASLSWPGNPESAAPLQEPSAGAVHHTELLRGSARRSSMSDMLSMAIASSLAAFPGSPEDRSPELLVPVNGHREGSPTPGWPCFKLGQQHRQSSTGSSDSGGSPSQLSTETHALLPVALGSSPEHLSSGHSMTMLAADAKDDPEYLPRELQRSGSGHTQDLLGIPSGLSMAGADVSPVRRLQAAYLGPRRRLHSRPPPERKALVGWKAATGEPHTDVEALHGADSGSLSAESSGEDDVLAVSKRSRQGRSRQRPRRATSQRYQCRDEEDTDTSDAEAGRVRRKHHNPWSLEETIALVNGVEACGGGKWADIKKRNYRAIEHRSAVDLKDKWRNLMRVAILPPHAVRTKCLKRREVPPELLDRVRKLSNITPGQKHVPGRRFVATSKNARSGSRARR